MRLSQITDHVFYHGVQRILKFHHNRSCSKKEFQERLWHQYCGITPQSKLKLH